MSRVSQTASTTPQPANPSRTLRSHPAPATSATCPLPPTPQLAIHHDKWDEWTTCFSIENLELPSSPFLGFSAHTGDVSDAHDIISITTSNVDYHPPLAGAHARAPPRKGVPGAGFFARLFGWVWFVIKWGALVGIIVAGGLYYRKQQSQKHLKRF